jgi:hypothetical protein
MYLHPIGLPVLQLHCNDDYRVSQQTVHVRDLAAEGVPGKSDDAAGPRRNGAYFGNVGYVTSAQLHVSESTETCSSDV